MHIVAILIGVIWIVFWLFWLGAALTAKSGRSRWGQFAGVRAAFVILIVLLLRLGVIKKHAGVTTNPWLEGIGLAVFLLGLGLAVWARIYIGRNWGMPMTEKAEPELVSTGPYHTVRHPIYSGILLALIGSALALGVYWFIAAAILGAYFIYSAVMEERYLTKLLPDSYPEYKRSTKMLIPYIL
ncbi:MAG: isoprenylcysteine carboxylmethyltransferase family protein [Streptosporangiaceae bacterium]|jgi:protein-S-isoprenylcysteine O-methyltransferase Ste14